MIHLDDALAGLDVSAAADEARAAHAAFERRRADGSVGFADAPARPGVVDACDSAAASIPSEVDSFVVLGIGGSSLGARAVVQALAPRARVFFPDNVDPATWEGLVGALRPARTAFVAVSKSGSTVETLAHVALARAWLAPLGKDAARARLVAVTDPTRGPLRDLARAEELVALDVPPNVGGRWCAFTPVGLLPARLAGIDATALLAGAADAVRASADPDLRANVALRLAAIHVLHDRLGRRIHVFFPYADALRATGEWFRQLWAESLGKRPDVGPTPVACVGATDQHSQLQLLRGGPDDKLVTFVSVAQRPQVPIPADPALPAAAPLEGRTLGELLDAERVATAASLAKGGRPSTTLTMRAMDARSLGALLMTWMLATAYAAEMYGVDAYDQPAVEEGKAMAREILRK